MTSLTAFISARIDEDDSAARAVDTEEWGGLDAWGPGMTKFYYGDHCFDPARVLKECAVKRYILQSYVADGEDPHPGFPCTDDIKRDPEGKLYEEMNSYDRGACERHLASWDHQHHSEFVLKVLALAWADHPDYNQEWAV